MVSEPAEISEQRWLLPRFWAIFLLLLISATYPLWLGGTGETEMPLVPLLSRAVAIPAVLSILPTVALLAALVLIAFDPTRFRGGWWVVSVALLASFLVDQHRLQPWAYQSAIYAVVFAAMDTRHARRWLIPLAASVYLYSAAGKFDFQFAHTVGQEFLQTITRPIGGLPEELSQSARAKLALIFPATELLAGVGLLFRSLRPMAATVVILMHLSLIGILGPWGLDHSTGVLVWNMLLIVQAYILILRSHSDSDDQPPENLRRGDLASRFARVVVVVALVAPIWERHGYWDHWTSWSLYSPHTSRVDIELHRSAIFALDPVVREYLQADADGDGWRKLAIDRWSLESRGVPIYPQARYQLALAEEIASRKGLRDEIRVRLQGVSDRWTGNREEQLMLGQGEINEGMKAFWLTR